MLSRLGFTNLSWDQSVEGIVWWNTPAQAGLHVHKKAAQATWRLSGCCFANIPTHCQAAVSCFRSYATPFLKRQWARKRRKVSERERERERGRERERERERRGKERRRRKRKRRRRRRRRRRQVLMNVWMSSSEVTVALRVVICLSVGCLTSQQHASVSQGRICWDNFTCCHAEIEVADPTFHLTQSQYTDTGSTSPSTDHVTPGAWQGSHWSANF